jgi:hypothetical protein
VKEEEEEEEEEKRIKRNTVALYRKSKHGGVLGEWRYSSTHSLTSALDGGEW